LLRTCRPADVPVEITMQCGTVENVHEQELPAIPVRRSVDEQNSYEILAVYNNNPNTSESGVLRIPKTWLGDRVVLDLSAQSENATSSQQPIVVRGEEVKIDLKAGDGKFFLVVTKEKQSTVLRRFWARRLEALRKMVEFDTHWLEKVGLRKPHEGASVKEDNPEKAFVLWLGFDKENQEIIRHSALSQVLRQLDAVRSQLSAANKAIDTWAIFKTGQPFPPAVEPGKSYCDAQTKLGELYVGFSDLAYAHTPEDLVKPIEELVHLAALQAESVRHASAHGMPREPSPLPADLVSAVEADLHRLGWVRPPTIDELVKGH
jgi:hypothetical protein